MPGVKRVQLDGWGGHHTGKVICVDSRSDGRTSGYYAQATAPVMQQRAKPFAAPAAFKDEPTKYGQQFHPANTGVDQLQVEIAKACNVISKQVATLPISIRECSVCLSSNAHTQMVPCGHVFHSRCFLRWFRTNRSCPLCRTGVDRVQLAPTFQDNDTSNDVDAIMQEDDDDSDDDMDVDSHNAALMHDADLIDFLSHAKASETDELDLLPLEDMEVLEEMTMDESVDESHHHHHEHHHHHSHAHPPPQYIPQTTLPNYWMVLNNGQALAPTLSRPAPSPSQAPRMVHIAPRPNTAHLHRPSLPSPIKADPPLRDLKMSPSVVMLPASTKTNSCRCAGGCRNGRCACVKEGSMCGVTCRCTSCKNPFLSIAMAGIDVSTLVRDDCFMHNLSKIRDMMTKLHEVIPVPCCPGLASNQGISILQCIDGFVCGGCAKSYDFSWCSNKLCDREKAKRNHCAKCKRCGDHRDVHCDDCGRCYFAGVSSSFACPCTEKASTSPAADAAAKPGDDEEEGCVIM
ncbi:hypothetical protein SDRG_16827 [Saprolegnia diclina VS20]|uniref:RING-type domain-containing protein n=1 Tax=Saprolegnia diclina (strain VS20) TaxID=1156394 RepID=T0PW86_SAPDV|nr:hypothetical protein SDRG_16827 [Saprolegnia diclina VS20]EQC25305.1 hypothetical protein SDRG_16827 [Saprolegnia diclina VS20]|eukprot:XP_008621271.1 hypothetical protein SDRG_16827 [Saprolegnia diclina VS20]